MTTSDLNVPRPRDRVIDLIHIHLAIAASAGKPIDDDAASLLLVEIERRALGKADGALIFCDPDMPTGFVAEERGDAASIRGSIA